MSFPLKNGSEGPLVKDLQTRLNKLGAGLIADGEFGIKTESALLKYTGKKTVDSQQELAKIGTAPPKKDVKTEFVLKHFTDAKSSEAVTKVPAVFTLAQGGLESGWGLYAFGNNFFGIKAGKAWTGEIQELKTWECGATGDAKKDGILDKIIQVFQPNTNPAGVCKNKFAYRVFGKFRKYATAKDGFIDHDNFLIQNKRYAKAFQHTDPKKFATEVAKAGYATAPDYEKVLHNTIDLVTKILQDNKKISL